MPLDTDLTLLYKFAQNKTLASIGGLGPTLGITRATTATYFDNNGIMQTASSGEARFDHNPATNASLGLLVEESRTQIAVDTGDVSDDAVWVPTNMTKGSDSVIDPTGNANVNVRLTAAAANATLLQTVTSAIDSYIYGVYMKRVTGTGDIDMTVDNGVTWVTKTLTSEWTRFSVTDASETNPVFGVRIVTDGDAIDFWGSDVNKGATILTSHIPNNADSGTVTRDADVITTTTLSWLDAAATAVGTWYVKAQFPFADAVANALLTLDDGGTTDRFYFERGADERINFATTHSADTDGAVTGTNVIAAATIFELGASYVDDDIRHAVDNTLEAADTSAAIPLADNPTTLRIGADSAGNYWNGHIAEIRYYNVQKNDTFIQNLSNGSVSENLPANLRPGIGFLGKMGL
jgi:hypothetical protein